MADTKDMKIRESARSYSTGRSMPTQYAREGQRTDSTSLDRYSSWQSPFYSSSPFSLMRRLAEDMDRIFGDFGTPTRHGADLWGGSSGQSLWAPQIETFRRGQDLVVRADLPGMNKDNVNVEIDDDMLILSGERQDEYNEERDDFYRSERSYGRFYRAIPLPDGVDPNACNAQFKEGVLEVTVKLPKEAERPRRKINIK